MFYFILKFVCDFNLEKMCNCNWSPSLVGKRSNIQNSLLLSSGSSSFPDPVPFPCSFLSDPCLSLHCTIKMKAKNNNIIDCLLRE